MQWINLFIILSILIVLHELGHFLAAKATKTKVEKFYLFFDFLFPFANLLNFSLFKKKKGDTEYGIGWFPLGGYVKIVGMVDESMDKEALKQPPQPWEFRSKNVWQRLLMMIGGILVNVVVGIIAYVISLGAFGEDYVKPQDLKYGMAFDSSAAKLGLQNGDIITAVDGVPVDNAAKVGYMVVVNQAKELTILRDGITKNLTVKEGLVKTIIDQKGSFGLPRIPTVIAEVSPKGNAEQAGLQAGDSLIQIKGTDVRYFNDFSTYLATQKNKAITLVIARGGSIIEKNVTVNQDGKIGIAVNNNILSFFNISHKSYGFFEAIPAGAAKAWTTMVDYLKQIKLIFFSKEVKVKDSLGGFGSFKKIMPSSFDWQPFLDTLALISLILAVANFLPIPGLDGGYILFLLWEMITGKKVSDKFLEYANLVGLVLLFTLMIFANGLDVWRYFGGK